MFITFEGMEGCGKSTQCERLTAHFIRLGYDVLRTLEPGGSPLGQELRRILLDPANSDITSVGELFLYLADRAQHVDTVIRPALDRDRVVTRPLCRFHHRLSRLRAGIGCAVAAPVERHGRAGTLARCDHLLDIERSRLRRLDAQYAGQQAGPKGV